MDEILYYILLLCVDVLNGETYNKILHAKCDDCTPIWNCTEASPYKDMTEENLKNLIPYYCGLSDSFNVCCSKLKVGLAGREHPNLKLLPDACGEIYNSISSRIIAGIFASLYEFPWMVLIAQRTSIGERFRCAGTLINTRYVLTAAHCVHNKDIAYIRVGEYQIGTDKDCEDTVCESNIQDIDVEKDIIHDDYNMFQDFINDIALLRLKKHVEMGSKNVGTICLPVSKELRNRIISSSEATVAGWGNTEYKKESSLLLKVNVPVLSNEKCHKKYYRYFSRSPAEMKKICAGEDGRDSCSGDSGGPLMLTDNYKGETKFVQYGIVSSGRIDCGSKFPALYTDVREYVDWILDNIKE